MAIATGAAYLPLQHDLENEKVIAEALKIADTGQPVIIDVNIDYSKRTFLTKGVVKTNLSRFPFKEKVRFLGRALKRHLLG